MVFAKVQGRMTIPVWAMVVMGAMNLFLIITCLPLVFGGHKQKIEQLPASRVWLLDADTDIQMLNEYEKGTRDEKAPLLREQLKLFRGSEMTPMLRRMLSVSSTNDVADAVLEQQDENSEQEKVVIDIGANSGWPATEFGIRRAYEHVVSVEPNSANIIRLRNLKPGARTSWHMFHGAAGDELGMKEMTFDVNRNDSACFNCKLTLQKREGIYMEHVAVATVDSLVLDSDSIPETAPVQFLKTDTQGHEGPVLRGAQGLLDSGRVKYLLVEFDTELLGTKENAMEVLNKVTEKGRMECTHLRFSKRGLPEDEKRFYQQVFLDPDDVESFYDTVLRLNSYTDIFCISKDQ